MREPTTELDALREVVESQSRLGHAMTIVPNDVLVRLIERVEEGRSADSLDALEAERRAHAITRGHLEDCRQQRNALATAPASPAAPEGEER